MPSKGNVLDVGVPPPEKEISPGFVRENTFHWWLGSSLASARVS